MNDVTRPNPDALLAAIQQGESRQRRGRLTVFLGMCAGVGKTYAMLEMAQRRKAEGVALVVAVAETHGRVETEALLEGLPVVPRRAVEYRGTVLHEMDLDAVLERRPQLAAVDELAHTNAPGSRHPKRYQDVLELLDAGIDVFTTVNVQHLESRVDVVLQITGVNVRETVPDSVLDEADDIRLVDLTPEELRERLADGKVYLGESAQRAAGHFFRPENLTALRELALRITAERVNQDLRDVMASRQIAGPWKTSTKFMVAVGPSPFAEELIRWTRRAASVSGAPWVAVYVEPPVPLDDDAMARVTKALTMARQLGAHVITTHGGDLVGALLRAAGDEHVTQLVVGKTLGHPLIEFLKGGSLVERLIRQSGDVDICVVRAGRLPAPFRGFAARRRARLWTRDAGIGLLSVVGVTAACWLMRGFTGYWAVSLIYLFLVVVLATQLRRRTMLVVAAASALLWDYLFIPPPFSFRIERFHDGLMCVMYFLVAMVIGQLTARLRFRELAERQLEQRTAALYRLSQEVAESTTLDEGLRGAVRAIGIAFGARTAVFLVDPGGQLGSAPHAASTWTLSDKERGLAAWAFTRNEPSGRYTDTVPEAEGLHLPLQTTKNRVGLLTLRFDQRAALALDERELLQTFADQIAVMIERYWLMQEAGRARVAEESERLYRTLFDSVSHEIKTPLAVIQAATSELELAFGFIEETRRARPFLKDIQTASRRLSRIVDNLLSMTRIESGRYKLNPVWCDVDELLAAAQQQVGDLLAKHEVRVTLPETLPSVKVDAGFVEQSLANLLANAALYSPEGSVIRLSARTDDQQLVLRVADEGPGLPAEAGDRIFEKFYRGPNAPPGGVGLGLSIVRGLMQALGGSVSAAGYAGQGAAFTLRFPVEMKYIPDSA